MNILFFLNPGEKGGSNKSTYMLAKKIAKNHSLNSVIITPKWNVFNEMARQDGMETFSIDYMYNGTHATAEHYRVIIKACLNKVYYWLAYRKLKKKFNWNETLIHSGMSILGIGSFLAKKTNAKHIMHLRENPFPWIYLSKKEISRMNKEVDTFISISADTTNNWIKAGLNPKKISTIYNGIEPNLITSKIEYSTEPKFGIMINGWLSKAKGTDIAIEAMSKLSSEIRDKVYVDFYGVGTSDKNTKEYEEMIKKFEIQDFVTLKGYTEDIPSLLKNYDIGLMNSAREAFGRTTVEYMFSGLAVIASNTGANTELIISEKFGLLYEYGNSTELVERICELVNDPKRIKVIGLNGKCRAYDNFTADKNAQSVFDLYENLMKRV